MDVLERKQNAILKNQCLFHEKLQIEEPLAEVEDEEESPEIADPFASLTTNELAYFEMTQGDDVADDDSDKEKYGTTQKRTMSRWTAPSCLSFSFRCLDAKEGVVIYLSINHFYLELV
jgi:hypothetical protein